MKIIYIAHPISGDIEGNLNKIVEIARHINLTLPNVTPIAPYFLDCHALNDDIPEERQRGITNDSEFFIRRIMDEVWLYGDKISNGMKQEIRQARAMNIPVISKSEGTKAF